MSPSIKNRLTASSIHFLLSAAIILVLVTTILLVWFPNNLYLAGASAGLTILVSVDLVLGPVLTFIVYNKQKKSLKFDLAFIVTLQVGFFIYGALLIYNERPVISVLADDGVNLVTISEAKDYAMDKTFSLFDEPEFVLIELPESREELSAAKTFSEVVDSRPYVSRFDLYKSMDKVSEQEYDNYLKFIYAGLSDDQSTELAELAAHSQQKDCRWVPLISYHASGYACINKSDGIKIFKQSKQ